MPLSFGIPFGLAIVLLGAILFFGTHYTKAAKILISLGTAAAALATIAVFLMAGFPIKP